VAVAVADILLYTTVLLLQCLLLLRAVAVAADLDLRQLALPEVLVAAVMAS
jgi:hypothetical protein